MLAAMKSLVRAGTAFGVALFVFGGVTWFALEGNEVAVVRTRKADGAVRETHVWPAEQDGVTWLEAATPESPWFVEAQRQPEIELVYAGATARYRTAPEFGSEGHAKIRRLLRAKYGWADRWVALLQDGSRSVAVRLEAVDPAR
jgi:hypothetical protein